MQIFVFVSDAATQKNGATKVNQIFMKMFFDADWWRCPPSSRALNYVRQIWCSFTWKISQLILVTRCWQLVERMRLYRLFYFWMAQTQGVFDGEKPWNQQVVSYENVVTQTIAVREQQAKRELEWLANIYNSASDVVRMNRKFATWFLLRCANIRAHVCGR